MGARTTPARRPHSWNIFLGRRCPRRVMVRSRIGLGRSNFGTLGSFFLLNLIFLSLNSFCIHRSDSVFMVPPFLAYYGLTTGNQSMLQEAYTQVRSRSPPFNRGYHAITQRIKNRSSCIAVISLTPRQMDCGSTSSWARTGLIPGTGRLVPFIRIWTVHQMD